jgi:hypothetical protein
MVELNTKEQQKYIVIKQYANQKISRKQAAVRLGLYPETISVLKTEYLKHGKQIFSHKNKANQHALRIDKKLDEEIVRLYRTEFDGFNFTHFYELLREQQRIRPDILPTSRTVFNILTRNGIASPVANRKKRSPDQHPIRPRREHFGELVQMDASLHDWLNLGADKKLSLLPYHKPKDGWKGALKHSKTV